MKRSLSFMRGVLGATLIALGLLGSTAAVAKDARVVVIAEGESFGSVPKFRLWADGRFMGEARLGRLPDKSGGVVTQPTGEALAHYGGQSVFIVPDIANVRFLGIGFSSDAGWSEGKLGVRSLTITGITVDGVQFDPRSLIPAGDANAEVSGKRVVLRQEGLFRVKRPASGWTQRTATATTVLARNQALKRLAAADKERRKAEARLAAAAEERRKVMAARLAAAEEVRKKAEAARFDAARDATQGEWTKRAVTKASTSGACGNIAALEITGYKENRAELPDGAAARLAGVARSLKGSPCRVSITGYASIDMSLLPAAGNVKPDIERMSMARAAAVASELKRLGVDADQITTASVIGDVVDQVSISITPRTQP